MALDLEHLRDDVPLGLIGRLAGLRVVSPEMREGEQVSWSARANMIQHRVRSVGGRLYLTDERLVFGRNRFESATGGKEWWSSLSDLRSASTGGKRSIRVKDGSGHEVRFLLRSPQESAETVDKAIQRARLG